MHRFFWLTEPSSNLIQFSSAKWNGYTVHYVKKHTIFALYHAFYPHLSAWVKKRRPTYSLDINDFSYKVWLFQFGEKKNFFDTHKKEALEYGMCVCLYVIHIKWMRFFLSFSYKFYDGNIHWWLKKTRTTKKVPHVAVVCYSRVMKYNNNNSLSYSELPWKCCYCVNHLCGEIYFCFFFFFTIHIIIIVLLLLKTLM